MQNPQKPLRMNRIYVAFLLLLLATAPVSAQRKAKKVAKTATVQKESPQELKRKQMVAATQKVVFIDSVVVDKQHFLDKYRLSADVGEIHRYGDFFKKDGQPNAYAYVNELGDKCYFSEEDTAGNAMLYSMDKLGNGWSSPKPLGGLEPGEELNSLNFPFVLNDGLTLYFSAKGTESLGGYDIFVTRFDPETGMFLKPENLGMPFNSEANDYMMAVDETDSIGWFATDRNQTAGKVCIYMFIPADTRQAYSSDLLTTAQIESMARIDRIADTWGDGKARRRALARLNAIDTAKKAGRSAGDFVFVVNDRTTYRKTSDFRTQEGRNMMQELLGLKAQHAGLAAALAKARDFYATASAADRRALTSEIMQSERQLEALEDRIAAFEKSIRNCENR